MIFKVTFYRFYIVVSLPIDVNLNATEVKVLKVKRVTTKGAVERFVVNHRDDNSARDLSGEQIFVHVVSHAGTNAVAFTDDTPDRILGIANFKSFSLLDKHGRRNVHLADQQFTFVYLDVKLRVGSIRHQTKSIL